MIKQNRTQSDNHPLSVEWTQHLKPTGGKVSFFGKGITCIDKLDFVSKHTLESVKEIDLSHNVITKLENVRQFENLEVLNLAHNKINDGRHFLKLGKNRKLKALFVKGNTFLKSGEGKIEAFKSLIGYETDIDILTPQVELSLAKVLKKYCKHEIKSQFYSQIRLQNEMISTFGFNSSMVRPDQNEGNTLECIFEQKSLEMMKECRKEFIEILMEENLNENLVMETKEQLQVWFAECLEKYSNFIDKEISSLSSLILEQQEKLHHAKLSQKEKIDLKLSRPLESSFVSKSEGRWVHNEISSPKTTRKQSKLHENSSAKNKFTEIKAEEMTETMNNKTNVMTESLGFRRNIQENFEAQYYNNLTKYNPVYQLLFSPLHSLKNKEKDLLIETLSAHLKEKSFALFKCDRLKVEMEEMKKKLEEEHELLEESEERFVSYENEATFRIRELEETNEEKTGEIDELTTLLTNSNKQIEELMRKLKDWQEKFSEMRLKQIKSDNALEKSDHEERVLIKIRAQQQERIKKEYLRALSLKASKLSNFNKTKSNNKNKEGKHLLRVCFNELLKEVENKKNKSKVESKVKEMRKVESMKIWVKHMKFYCSQTELKTWFQHSKQLELLELLKEKHQIMKRKEIMINSFQHRNNYQIVSSIFVFMKNQVSFNKETENNLKAENYYKEHLLQKYFKLWLIFLRMPIYIQSELTVDLKTEKIKRFLYLLSDNCRQEQNNHEKLMDLVVFLNKSKRFEYFEKFKASVETDQKLLLTKEKRVKNLLKQSSMLEYLRIMVWLKKYKALSTEKHIELANIRKKAFISQFSEHIEVESARIDKNIRKKNFIRIVEKFRKLSIGDSLKESLKEFMLEDRRVKLSIKEFFSQIQSYQMNRIKIKSKENQLKLFLKQNRAQNYELFRGARFFISSLLKPVEIKARLKNYLSQKYLRKMTDCFKEWRVVMFQEKIQMLTDKIHEFGPEIEEISRRQKTTFEEKNVLMSIIESKEKTIKNYLEQLEEAEYTIRAKEEKYQKLKEYYYDQGDDVTVVGSKVQPAYQTKLTPERDFDSFALEDKEPYFPTFRRF